MAAVGVDSNIAILFSSRRETTSQASSDDNRDPPLMARSHLGVTNGQALVVTLIPRRLRPPVNDLSLDDDQLLQDLTRRQTSSNVNGTGNDPSFLNMDSVDSSDDETK